MISGEIGRSNRRKPVKKHNSLSSRNSLWLSEIGFKTKFQVDTMIFQYCLTAVRTCCWVASFHWRTKHIEDISVGSAFLPIQTDGLRAGVPNPELFVLHLQLWIGKKDWGILLSIRNRSSRNLLSTNALQGELSAYSVFNEGMKSLPGELKASQFEAELRHKM